MSNELPKPTLWWHSFKFPDGEAVEGHGSNELLIKLIDLPEDLTFKGVLDVGAWDGFYSIECIKRGADFAYALDRYGESFRDGVSHSAGIRYAANKFGIDVYDGLSYKQPPAICIVPGDANFLMETRNNCSMGGGFTTYDKFFPEMFDLVLGLGILYHLRFPNVFIKDVATLLKPGGLFIIETYVSMMDLPYPAARYFPGEELNHDVSNFYGMNTLMLMALLEHEGFSVEVKGYTGFRGPCESGYFCSDDRVIIHATKNG